MKYDYFDLFLGILFKSKVKATDISIYNKIERFQ